MLPRLSVSVSFTSYLKCNTLVDSSIRLLNITQEESDFASKKIRRALAYFHSRCTTNLVSLQSRLQHATNLFFFFGALLDRITVFCSGEKSSALSEQCRGITPNPAGWSITRGNSWKLFALSGSAQDAGNQGSSRQQECSIPEGNQQGLLWSPMWVQVHLSMREDHK